MGRSRRSLYGGEGGTESERTGPGATDMHGRRVPRAGRGWHGPHGMGGGASRGHP